MDLAFLCRVWVCRLFERSSCHDAACGAADLARLAGAAGPWNWERAALGRPFYVGRRPQAERAVGLGSGIDLRIHHQKSCVPKVMRGWAAPR